MKGKTVMLSFDDDVHNDDDESKEKATNNQLDDEMHMRKKKIESESIYNWKTQQNIQSFVR